MSRAAPRPRLVIFDLDGVIYRGDTPVPGAAELVGELHAAGRLVRFATNNSTVTRAEYVERLRAMRIEAARDEIVTSTWATIEHLRAHQPDVQRVLAVGEGGLAQELLDAGYAVTRAQEALPDELDGAPLASSFDACVVGLDRAFDYVKLAAAVSAVRAGARLIATNADSVYPTAAGSLPGAGAMVAAIAAASGGDPLVIGKPEPAMFELILEAAGVPPVEAVVVGDNPDADVVAARRAAIPSILVLTGVADRVTAERLDGERRPDHVLADPRAVGELIERWPDR